MGTLPEEFGERDHRDFLAVEDERDRLARSIGLYPGVFAPAIGDLGIGMYQQTLAGDIDSSAAMSAIVTLA